MTNSQIFRCAAFLFTVYMFISSVRAQHIEVGVQFGASAYSGDLTPSTLAGYTRGIRPSGGAFLRYNFLDALTFKLGGSYGRLVGNDAWHDNPRNLQFETHLIEGSLTAEWNILGYQPDNLYRVFSPYLFAGVGFFNFNPKAEYQGEKVALQPLSTEGQGLPQYPNRTEYALSQLTFPVGLGFKYALNDKWNIGLEGGLRITNTDYIDDVSTTYVLYDDLLAEKGTTAAALSNRSGQPVSRTTERGSPNRDYYFIAGITVSYNFLDNGLMGVRSHRSGGKKGCKY